MNIELSITLTPKQIEILEACTLGNGIQYVIACTGRQATKTTTDILATFKWMVSEENYNVGFFLPTHKQCSNVFNRMKKMLSGFEDNVKFNKVSYTITLFNGSTVQFFTSENDNCRGFTFDAIVVDEACFVKDIIWQEAIEPTVAVSLSKLDINGVGGNFGKVLLTSTPKSKNWFYNMVMIEDDRSFITRFTSEEGGIISKDILNRIKKRIPEAVWMNEYMGEFLDAGNGLFRYIPCIKDNKGTKGVTAGLDLGAKEDYTVLTIMDGDGNLIHINRWTKQEWNIILDSVIIELKKYGSPVCWVETNGVGQMPYETLLKKYSKVKPWVTTQKSKNDIIQKLILDFNTNNISILGVDYLKDELDAFSVEYKNGNASYGGSNGYHDDSVMSLAICNFNRNKIVNIIPQTFKRTTQR